MAEPKIEEIKISGTFEQQFSLAREISQNYNNGDPVTLVHDGVELAVDANSTFEDVEGGFYAQLKDRVDQDLYDETLTAKLEEDTPELAQ